MSDVTYQARIVASAELARSFRDLDLDILPGHTRTEDDRLEVDAILTEVQIRALVSKGAIVTLVSVIDPKFPKELIMGSEEIAARARDLALPDREE